MALTQMQLIQSLGDALAWLERELQWGISATQQPHLCGRIGELYAALVTNGQMAVAVNQRGYDVVSAGGERISVKTTATMSGAGHVSFNPNSMSQVDRVMVLRVNTEEMQVETLFDGSVAEAMALMTAEGQGKRTFALSKLTKESKLRSEIRAITEVRYGSMLIRELESGTIKVEQDGMLQTPALPALKKLAMELNVPLLNSSGNPVNTRQLGSRVIKTIAAFQSDALKALL